jgi:hypothetical protein
VRCAAGGQLTGPSATTCFAGTLKPQSCGAKNCTVAAPANGFLGTCDPLIYSGAECSFTCSGGYTLSPSSSVSGLTSCLNGVTKLQSCTPSACIVNRPDFGDFGVGSSRCPTTLSHGATCQFSCVPGYTLTGPATQCQFGNIIPQSCIPSVCAVPIPTGGTRGTCGATVAHGTECQVACNQGYTLGGDSLTLCQYGKLTLTQKCNPNSCPVSAPLNGTTGDCPSKKKKELQQACKSTGVASPSLLCFPLHVASGDF